MRCLHINADRQQCRLDADHPGTEHDFRPRHAAPLLGRITSTPKCPGCGTISTPTEAWPGGKPCEVCSQKPRFAAPPATIETGAQPEPAYQRADYTGNFPPPRENT